ncbi:hypothetical protein T484DRAFT_2966628 [Baffinella frigidus]|nr:hypothetical protein T484DRAFT_2966628 [Cryptophyta sp. CCMP2293]
MPPTTRARSGSRSPANPFAPKPGASATPSKAKGKPAPVSFEAGIEKEVREHWIDVPCSWALLSTIAGLCFAGDYLIPPICGTSEGSFLTFSCPDAIIFGWIFCWTAFLVKMLPPQTNNPMELWFCSGMPLRKRAVKFVLQLLAALSFAFAMKHFAKPYGRTSQRKCTRWGRPRSTSARQPPPAHPTIRSDPTR